MTSRHLAPIVLLISCASGDAATVGACGGGSTSGDDPALFCDDKNPCTADTNCTPCSTLPPGMRDIYHCTADDEIPPVCAPLLGCAHVALTTPDGQINDCFPVAHASELRAGVCRSGVCVDNP